LQQPNNKGYNFLFLLVKNVTAKNPMFDEALMLYGFFLGHYCMQLKLSTNDQILYKDPIEI
jgi:hypothetical protein